MLLFLMLVYQKAFTLFAYLASVCFRCDEGNVREIPFLSSRNFRSGSACLKKGGFFHFRWNSAFLHGNVPHKLNFPVSQQVNISGSIIYDMFIKCPLKSLLIILLPPEKVGGTKVWLECDYRTPLLKLC